MAAAALRIVSLGRPVELVFDEIFYARDACWYVIGTESVCGITDLASRAHPPMGKWLIGSGIAAFGYEPFGWRIAAAVAGTIGVALLYLLAWRLLRRVVASREATVGNETDRFGQNVFATAKANSASSRICARIVSHVG